MNKETLINILLSLADEELRMFARWLVAHIPSSLHDFLETPIAVRLLGPASAWVESLGADKVPLMKALYEKLSDMLDAAAHELFTKRSERTNLAAQWRSELETEPPPRLAAALATHGGGMGVKEFLQNAWRMFDAAVTSLDQWLAPFLREHADRLERHPAMRERLARKVMPPA